MPDPVATSPAPPFASFQTVYGVDFSGAKKAGRTMWVAEATPTPAGRLRLVSLNRIDRLCRSVEKETAHPFLADLIGRSEDAIWGIDFPFGLPIELFPRGWPSQLNRVRKWEDGAHAFGVDCLERARARGGPLHIRRLTDTEQRVPFDPYHYRIIYQTFFGMRDVAKPLFDDEETAVLPFEPYAGQSRVVVEACPGTTLHHLDLPYQNYKQATGGPLTAKRRRTRRAIVDGVAPLIEISDHHQRVVMRDPGADALDAVIAAVGLRRCWDAVDHATVATHKRYPREGRIYA